MPTLQDEEIERIARMIQRKIARVGTKPTHFVKNSLPKLRKLLDAIIRKNLRDPS